MQQDASTEIESRNIAKTIRYTLILAVVTFIFVIVILWFISYQGLIESNKQLQRVVDATVVKTELVYNMRISARERNFSLLQMILSDDIFTIDEEYMNHRLHGSAFLVAREKLLTMQLSDYEHELLNKQRDLSISTVTAQRQVIDKIQNDDKAAALEMVNNVITEQTNVFNVLDDLVALQKKENIDISNEAVSQLNNSLKTLFGLGIVAISVLIIVAVFIINRVSKQTKAVEIESQKFKTLFEGAMDGVMVIGRDSVVECNYNALNLFSVPDINTLNTVGMDYLTGLNSDTKTGSANKTWDYLKKSLQQACRKFEYELKNSEGKIFPASIQLTDIMLKNEPYVQMVIRDITERHQFEAKLKQMNETLEERVKLRTAELDQAHSQLLQSEKMASVGQLAAGVAHEINNPIGYVNSNIVSMKKYVDDSFRLIDAYKRLVDKIQGDNLVDEVVTIADEIDLEFIREDINELIDESTEGIRRVKQIVQDLKDFSHLDRAEWQYADIHHGIDSTLNVAHNEIKYKAEIIKNYAALPQVECIPSQLNQVFMNLFVNAAHAIEDRGAITITTSANEDQVYIIVEDTGKGIEEEHLNKIFEPFFTTKELGKGTGLGLSLSFGIIQKHNGTIEVSSEVGKGSRFEIKLPIKQEESQLN